MCPQADSAGELPGCAADGKRQAHSSGKWLYKHRAALIHMLLMQTSEQEMLQKGQGIVGGGLLQQ